MLTPVPHYHSDDTYCLVLLQLFLPVTTVLSLEQNKRLVMLSVQSEGQCMNDTDWSNFVDRLTKYDPDYSPGQFADQGDLINYILSLTLEAACLYVLQFQETLTFRCNCPGGSYTEKIVPEMGLIIHNSSDEPLAQQILNTFQPEPVSDY